jgi:predicted phage terminase large subunit-like protein
LPALQRQTFLASLTIEEKAWLALCWPFWARPEQLTPPGDWQTWLILAGRGFGKTRACAEDVKAFALQNAGSRIAIVAPTAADARDTCVEGESGLLSILPRSAVATYNRSLGELILANGSRFKLFSAEEPERLRGPQFHRAWADELASWKQQQAAWDMLQFGLRLGRRPRTIVGTTPKPSKLLKQLLASADTVVTRGSTYDNRDNLASSFYDSIVSRYEGTRLGRQEIHAEVLDDLDGALWQAGWIDDHRVSEAPELKRVVVAIDPAVTANADSDQTGIAVAGQGHDGHFYVLHAGGYKLSPQGWASRAVELYQQHNADRLVAERNQGGDLVAATIKTVAPGIAVKTVHASKGKQLRAEPIAALYEQGRVHHVGVMKGLEDQLLTFPVANEHDDQLDSLVYAITELAEQPTLVFKFI